MRLIAGKRGHMEVDKIYLDMDGVLADFERGVKEICGLTPPSQNAKHHKPGEDDEMWKAIKACPHFYDYLELMPGAKAMFDAVYGKYGDKCEILTGIPKPRREIVNAASDKKAWVKRLLSEDIKLFVRVETYNLDEKRTQGGYICATEIIMALKIGVSPDCTAE